jgi:3-oxoacyl-[acyl-carrier protein] reductase
MGMISSGDSSFSESSSLVTKCPAMSSPAEIQEPLPAQELAGQVAVVTGSSRGVGAAIALELAAAGADVLVHGFTSQAAAEGLVQQVQQLGRKSMFVKADLAETDCYEQFVESAWQWQQGVNIWVNNAGADVLTGQRANDTFQEKLQRLWQVDVQGTIGLSRLAGKRMQAAKAASPAVILNIGWDQALWGMAGDSGEMFAAIKGAIMAFSRSLAQSLAPQVRVNCLAPGWIKTAWGEQASDGWQERAAREALLERWGTPQDVAAAARFLVSPSAAFITGQVIPVNGGFRYGD